MGPGIFTKYSKQVIGGLIACFVLLVAIPFSFRFRGPIDGVSPYTEVNDFFEQEKISFAVVKEVYSADAAVVEVVLRNDTSNTVVAPAPGCLNEWLLETRVDGAWHSMRLSPDCTEKYVRWEYPQEEYGPNSGPSGVVGWNGGEQRYLCNIEKYYGTPQEPGLYRIVFPEMEHRDEAALAAEFYFEELEIGEPE